MTFPFLFNVNNIILKKALAAAIFYFIKCTEVLSSADFRACFNSISFSGLAFAVIRKMFIIH